NPSPPPAPYTLSLHDALPISPNVRGCGRSRAPSAFASCERHAHPGPPPPGAYLRLVPPESADGLPTLRGTVSASRGSPRTMAGRSEEHTSELQSRFDLVCRLL